MAGKAAAIARILASAHVYTSSVYEIVPGARSVHAYSSGIVVVQTLHVLFGGDDTYMYAMYVCVFIQY